MNRWRSPLIFLPVVLLMMVPFISAQEHLKNGDFRAVEPDGTPSEWRVSGGAPALSIDSDDPAPEAKQSLKVTLQAEGENLGAVLQKIRKVDAQSDLLLSGYVKSSKPDMATMQVKLYRAGEEMERISTDWSSTVWQRQKKSIPLNGADSVAVLLRFKQNAEFVGEHAWFAGISLTEEPPVPFAVGAGSAVPTFHNMGLYVDYDGDAPEGVRTVVRYREQGQDAWISGLPMVKHELDRQFRSSLFGLRPGANYEIEVDILDGDRVLKTVAFSGEIWSEDPPVAVTHTLPAVGDKPLVISEKGTPEGYILYRPEDGQDALVDGEQDENGAILVKNAAYVILERLTVRGGAKHGIKIVNSHHVHVRRCDVAGWGDPGIKTLGAPRGLYLDKNGKLINNQAGIWLGPGASQTVIEDNYVHHPRGTASSWMYGHAAGPEGIHQFMTDGNNVIRNNDIIGAEEHWWNDGFAGSYNREIEGGMHRDGDGYGNIIAFCNDDGAELDGGQINIRFYNNWIDKALCGISGAPNRRGPSYLFRNLLILGEERGIGGSAFKMGGSKYPAPGTTFMFHNTCLGFTRGISTHYGDGPVPLVTRNNIFAMHRRYSQAIAFKFDTPIGDFDYDLILPEDVRNPIPGREAHAVRGAPAFVDVSAGDFRLAPESPGIGAAVRLDGVNATASPADLGALPHDWPTADFPSRPQSMSVLPMHLRIVQTQGQEAAVGRLRIRIPPTAGKTWRAHPNSPWLVCDPAVGETGDQEQVVEVRLADTGLPVREHRGAVTLRTDSGYNRSAMVFFRLMPAEIFQTTVEAETGAVGAGFAVEDDPDASGGRIVAATERAEEGGLRLSFTVPSTGTYYAFVRARASGSRGGAAGSNGMLYQLDSGERRVYNGNIDVRRWEWDPLVEDGAAPTVNGGTHVLRGEELVQHLTKERVRLELSAGTHTLTFYAQEPGFRLDKVAISNHPYADALE